MFDLFAKPSSKILFLLLFTETFILHVNIKAMIFNANILVSYKLCVLNLKQSVDLGSQTKN